MARLVRLEQTGPLKVDPASLPPDKPIFLCQCGLSAKYPYCDGSHKITRAEIPGQLYTYSQDAKSILETRPDPQSPPSPGNIHPPNP